MKEKEMVSLSISVLICYIQGTSLPQKIIIPKIWNLVKEGWRGEGEDMPNEKESV